MLGFVSLVAEPIVDCRRRRRWFKIDASRGVCLIWIVVERAITQRGGMGGKGFKNTNANNKGRFIDLYIVKLFIATTCLINVFQYWRQSSM